MTAHIPFHLAAGRRALSASRVATRWVDATTLPRKGPRVWGVFFGDDDGEWSDPHDVYDRPAYATWRMHTSRSEGGTLLEVDGATESNYGFRQALREIVREYPEMIDFQVAFDGPPKAVRDLLRMPSPRRTDWSKVKLYHGTTSEVWASVMSDGLRPRGETNVEPVYGTMGANAEGGRVDAVYLTDQQNTAHMAAIQAARKHGGDPVVFEVWGLDPAKVLPDEDSKEDTAEASLARIGSVAYAGTIPPRNLRMAELMTAGRWEKMAGILQAPPKMVEAITDWIVTVAADEALRQIEDRRAAMAIPHGTEWVQMQSGPFAMSESDARVIRQELLDELDEVEREARRLGGRPPSGSAPREYTKSFPLDLRGWKHEEMVTARLAERREKDPTSLWMFDRTYNPVAVVVYRTLTSPDRKAMATWRGGSLTVWGLPSYLHRKKSFRSYVGLLQQAVRHELQHLAQDLLREATQVDAAGGRTNRSSPHPAGLPFRDEHALRDVEFPTRLRDEIEAFLQEVVPKAGRGSAVVRAFVGDGPPSAGIEVSDFFAALNKYDKAKWRRAVAEFVLDLAEVKTAGTRTASLVLYHGAQRWEGMPEIRPHRKGQAEHGPGIYLTTSWETANKYAKGGGAVYRMTLDSPRGWAENVRISAADIREFAMQTLGKGKAAKDLLAAVDRVSARTGDMVPAFAVIAMFVNADIASGRHGPALAQFLERHGVDASHVHQGNEDWVVVFNPALIKRVEKLGPKDVGSPEYPFDLPRVSRSAARVASRYLGTSA